MSENKQAVEEVAAVEITTVTPYEAAKMVNAALRRDGITGEDGEVREIPPQMMYNYVRKGVLKTVDGRRKGEGLQVEVEVIRAWYGRYVTRLAERAGRGKRELPEL